ncbi:hypothetical protein C8J57DRAFT_1500501 [Mycena rebaudengoi]|nr:hypothetical protein C8J57DRAFT_1500501 [Mycena rebaudengoi]
MDHGAKPKYGEPRWTNYISAAATLALLRKDDGLAEIGPGGVFSEIRRFDALCTWTLAGVKQQNLQIAGDSAGGNLIMQLFSHIGTCLISPWVFLTVDSPCHSENDEIDYLSRRGMKHVGALILDGVPETDRAFAEAAKAPEGWFEGVDRIANRVLITAGSVECLRDDIVIFGEGLKKHHPNVELVVQKGGLHDMFLDFFVKEKKLGNLTPLIVEWLAAGFEC